MKIMKEKASLIKTHTANVVGQPHIKLIEMLKDKVVISIPLTTCYGYRYYYFVF